MAEQKESSVLFSLKELMNLEEDRIKQEDEEKKRRAEAEVQSRVEAERRARDQEQMRLSAEEERRRSEEQRKKEEAARVEAIRHAEIEKARVEAEQRARMEAMTKQQEHERAMSFAQARRAQEEAPAHGHLQHRRRRTPFGCRAWHYLGKIKPENEAREAAARAALVQQAEESAKMKRLLEEQTQKVNDTMAQLAAAHDENTRNELKQKLAEAQKQQQATRQAATGGGGRPSGGDAPAKKPCNCQAGDPICSCL